jgi:DNA-binding GntR family transcriptional regulator
VGIDRWSEEPYYRQLAAIIRAQIEAGELAPGQPLPSEQHMMDTYGLARNTVRQALAALRESGHIETRKRRGSRVLGREHWRQA